MPQLNQLALVAYSQFFWLLVVLALIYFGIGKLMLPKIQSTVEARDKRIADDLAAAQAARSAADETEAAYRARIDESRAEALKVAAAAKASSARATEERMRVAGEANQAKVEQAEARIRAAADAALAEIADVAADAAQDMVSRLAGVKVSAADAKQAVKAAMGDSPEFIEVEMPRGGAFKRGPAIEIEDEVVEKILARPVRTRKSKATETDG